MSDPSSAMPCVLVVADPERQIELVGALSEPLPTTVVSKIDVLVSTGGDDAIELFEARKPHVLVVTATLETGDTRALVEALRGMVPRTHAGVVVIGDPEGGRIRNANDAEEMAPDRFVSRPMQPRTLRFAVASALEAVISARTGVPVGGPIAPRASGTQPRAAAVPAPQTVPAVPVAVPIDAATESTRAELRQRWAELADSMAEEDDEAAAAAVSAAFSSPSEGEGSTAPPAAAEVIETAPPTPVDKPWSESPELPPREPTLILREPVPPAAPVAPASSPTPMPPATSATTTLPGMPPAQVLPAVPAVPLMPGAPTSLSRLRAGEADASDPMPLATLLGRESARDLVHELRDTGRAREPRPTPARDTDRMFGGADRGPTTAHDTERTLEAAASSSRTAASPPEGVGGSLSDHLIPALPSRGGVPLSARNVTAPMSPRAKRASDRAPAPPLGPAAAAPSPERAAVAPPSSDRAIEISAAPIDLASAAPSGRIPAALPHRPDAVPSGRTVTAPMSPRAKRASDRVGTAPGVAGVTGVAGAIDPTTLALSARDVAPLGGHDTDRDLGPPPVREVGSGGSRDSLVDDLALATVPRKSDVRLEVLDDVPDVAPPAPSSTGDGRDFARQLRAKMSQMAQRLFQGADTPPPTPADLAPSHDHSAEIDLSSLGDDPPLAGVADLEARARPRPAAASPELAGAPGSGPNSWDSHVRERGLADQGEIVRGISDAAMLHAKMFAGSTTGRVHFRRDGNETIVYFDQGRPVFASSNESRDRMGALLVREGKITASQYERCQSVVAESGRRMGEILVDFGYLKRRELLPAVRRHVEDLIYALFGWDTGAYLIAVDTQPSAERIRLSRHPASLILEGVRRKHGRSVLERLIGPTSTVIEVADRERLGGIINMGDLSAEERAALAAFDGQADLAQVARTAGIDLADVLPLAWGLCVLGLASARRPDTEPHDESTALVGETDLAIDRERVRARWQLVTEADYFALLGVRHDATAFEIRRAYQAARRDFAADGFPPDLRRELAQELDDIANVLDEAFRVLRDDRLRQTYLANLIE